MLKTNIFLLVAVIMTSYNYEARVLSLKFNYDMTINQADRKTNSDGERVVPDRETAQIIQSDPRLGTILEEHSAKEVLLRERRSKDVALLPARKRRSKEELLRERRDLYNRQINNDLSEASRIQTMIVNGHSLKTKRPKRDLELERTLSDLVRMYGEDEDDTPLPIYERM